ncbi:alpha/beta hydrolase [Microbacterium sp. NPDC077184]|uniref:alpha/beta fold hydrolase n=1 Tax=Microbacterium sp. NPDC077184 TaxID=3154764 RepID=UPI003422D8B9
MTITEIDLSPVPSSGDPLRRNNVTVSGSTIGRTIMFAHGFGCSQETWNLVAPQFAADHQVVLFDQVGAGLSDGTAFDREKYDTLDGYAADLVEIVEALDVTEVTLVGHSVGAIISVLAANRAPERFRALVLVSPSPCYLNDGDYLGGFENADLEALIESLEANYLGWAQQTAPIIMGRPDRPELGERLTDGFCRVDPAIASHFARVTFLSDNRADLAGVSIPTLVIQTREDAISPPPVGRYVHTSIPGSSYVELDTSGHVPILSAPDQVVRSIREFLT